MKRLLVAIFALIALFALVSCDDKDGNHNTSPDTEIAISQSEKAEPSSTEPSDKKEVTAMYVYVNGNKLQVALAKNSSVDALVKILKQGDITYTADDYGDFEKVGSLGYSLPTENSQITTQAGDVVLYSGNQIVLFYGSNSWSYTRLGKISGYSTSELRTLLGAGSGTVQVKLSLK